MLLVIKKNGTKRNDRAIARQQTPEQYHEELLSTKNRLFICFVCTHWFGNCETGSRQSNKSLPLFISRRSCFVHPTPRCCLHEPDYFYFNLLFFFDSLVQHSIPKKKGTTHSHALTESFSLFWYAYPKSDDIQIYNNVILFVVPDSRLQYNTTCRCGRGIGVLKNVCGARLWELGYGKRRQDHMTQRTCSRSGTCRTVPSMPTNIWSDPKITIFQSFLSSFHLFGCYVLETFDCCIVHVT